MGRKHKEIQAEIAAEENYFADKFSQHSKARKRRPSRGPAMSNRMIQFQQYWLNDPDNWTEIKSKKHDRRRKSLARFLFIKYAAPGFLYEVWDDDKKYKRYVPWFITVAQGGSLFKQHTKGLLSKKETYMFLKGLDHFTIEQNIWYARAVCYGENIGVAQRIARSKLHIQDYADEFWISVMRFFVQNPVEIREMNDLIDYIAFQKMENAEYTMKGRTLLSVGKQSEEWLRLLAKKAKYGGVFPSMGLSTSSYFTGKKDKRTKWTFHQIGDGRALVDESHAMRHCVSAYANSCAQGNQFIWSLVKPDIFGYESRCLTISVDSTKLITEVRGKCNRSPTNQEWVVVEAWANDNGLTLDKRGTW